MNKCTRGRRGRDRMVVDLQLPMQFVPITTDVRGVQHYVIKFVCDLWQAGRWFSPGTLVSSNNKTDSQDINEIFLKVALNTIKPIKP